MGIAETAPTISDDVLARRNALVLALAQALGGSSTTITFALGGLVGHYLADDKSLATLPISCSVLGTAFTTIAASWLTRRFGRRLGFMIGAAIGLAGSALAVEAILLSSFWLFCLATTLTGAYAAFVQLYRYAAADTASEAFKAKAISWVLAGGVAAGVLGPQLVIFTRDLLAPIAFAGAFVAQGAIALVAVAVVSLVNIPRPPRLSVAESGRPILEIVRQQRFVVAALCGIASYALMSLVMTAGPLAMVGCNHSVSEAALGIQWHVIAMFAPSFFTGNLINRFGKEKVIAAGLLLLAGCGIVALAGLDLMHFWGALVLLGVGWNFGFIGATAMITETYRPEERNRVQGVNDFLVFTFVAIASFSSGKMLDTLGWQAINMVIFPVAALCLALLSWSTRQESEPAP